MSDYAAALAGKAAPVTFTDPDTGKVYTISYLVQAKKVEFEMWVQDNAIDTLLRLKGRIPDEEWQAEWRQFRDECSAGFYSFNSDIGTAALKTNDGLMKLGSILFGCPMDEFLALMIRHKDKVSMLRDLIISKSLPKPMSEGEEGNAPKAAAQPAA